MRESLCFERHLQPVGRNPIWIAGATRVCAAAARSFCAQVLANAFGHSTAPLSRNLTRASARAIPASLVKNPG
jgi:hypothetical protein